MLRSSHAERNSAPVAVREPFAAGPEVNALSAIRMEGRVARWPRCRQAAVPWAAPSLCERSGRSSMGCETVS